VKIVRYFVIILIVLVGFLVIKKTKTNMRQILPERCVFLVDDGLSKSFQDNVTSLISMQYAESKNPQEVIAKISQQFPEVSSMKVHLCQTDKICFSLELQKPLFLLNDLFVVCDSDVMIPKEHFSLEVVRELPLMTCQGEPLISSMVLFFEKLPQKIQQNFLVRWASPTEIILQEKGNKSIAFLVAAESALNEKDIEQSKLIYESLPVKNKKKFVTFDVRFKNQIVVR